MATPTWTPRCSGIRWGRRPAGTASPAWSWATVASPWRPAPRPTGPSSSAISSAPRTSPQKRWRRASSGGGPPTPRFSTPPRRHPKGSTTPATWGPPPRAPTSWGGGPSTRRRPRTTSRRWKRGAAARSPRGAWASPAPRSPSPETPAHRPVAGRVAPWDEVRRLGGVMGEMNTGIFEIAGEGVDRHPGNPGLKDYHRRLRELAVETGRPITFGVFSRKDAPDIWRNYLKLLEETAAAGGRMFGQVHSRWLSAILSFKTQLPFDRLPVWKDLRALPLAEQKQRLRDPELRRRLVEAARERDTRKALGTEARPPVYDWLFVMDTVEGPHQTVAEAAKKR